MFVTIISGSLVYKNLLCPGDSDIKVLATEPVLEISPCVGFLSHRSPHSWLKHLLGSVIQVRPSRACCLPIQPFMDRRSESRRKTQLQHCLMPLLFIFLLWCFCLCWTFVTKAAGEAFHIKHEPNISSHLWTITLMPMFTFTLRKSNFYIRFFFQF